MKDILVKKLVFMGFLVLNLISVVIAEEIVVKSIDETSASWINYSSDVLFEKSNTKIHLDSAIDKRSKKLESFQIITEWGKIIIPQNILSQLNKPQINTIDVSYTPFKKEDADWAFSVRFHFGEYHSSDDKNEEEFNLVEISFDKNSILDVTVFNVEEDLVKLLYEKK